MFAPCMVLMTASPAPSNASSVGPKPQHVPITYGQSQQMKKKKKNRILDSDDERCMWTETGCTRTADPQLETGQQRLQVRRLTRTRK